MLDRNANQRYESLGHMVATIEKTRPAYDGLLRRLTELGTEVARDRLLETDTVPPGRFVRKGRVEFIFPPQPEAELLDFKVSPVEGTLGQLVTEEAKREFDGSLVDAHLVVDYNDANNWAEMSVVDIRDESRIPAEVIGALDEAFMAYE